MECAPTVRGEIKKARASNYDLCSAINEFVDNSLDAGAENILIDVRERWEETRFIHKILVSDDSPKGVHPDNLKNIFSWTYERDRKSDEIGEFGTGFKAASVNLANKLTMLTTNGEECIQAIADWHEMAEENIWIPKIMKIESSFLKTYHPFATGTTLMLEDIRHEFIQQQKGNDSLLVRLYEELSLSYKYYLKHHPRIAFHLRGVFGNTRVIEEREISYSQKTPFMNYFFEPARLTVQTKVLVFKDNTSYQVFLHRENSNYWETVEFVEKRKNGNNILRSIQVAPQKHKKLIDTLLFRSCTYFIENEEQAESRGTVDIIRHYRILGKNISYRIPRSDPHVAYIKHELVYNNKWLNALLGIQFNKSNDGNIPEGDMRHTLEHIQKLHEKELIRFEKQKLGRIIIKEKEDEYLDLEMVKEEEEKLKTFPVLAPVTISETSPSRPPLVLEKITPLLKPESNLILPDTKKPIPIDIQKSNPQASIPPETNKRKHFSLETKLEVIKKQECRDSLFDFKLLDDILPSDYDHKNGRENNSKENCQVLSVISHALKTRRPEVFEKHGSNKIEFIVSLLNCITSSKYFLEAFQKKKIRLRETVDWGREGIFEMSS